MSNIYNEPYVGMDVAEKSVSIAVKVVLITPYPCTTLRGGGGKALTMTMTP